MFNVFPAPVLQHLFSCDLDGKELRSADDCVERLKLLDEMGRVWGQNMLLQVRGANLLLTDIETKVNHIRSLTDCVWTRGRKVNQTSSPLTAVGPLQNPIKICFILKTKPPNRHDSNLQLANVNKVIILKCMLQ